MPIADANRDADSRVRLVAARAGHGRIGAVLFTLLLALLIVSPVTADESASRTYTRYTGNRSVGAKLVSSGELRQSATLVRAAANLAGYIRLFGRTYEGARIEAASQVYRGKSSNTLVMKIAGYTVYSSNRCYGWSKDWKHSQTFFKKSQTITVGGIPISCSVRVGGTLYANLKIGVAVVGAGISGKAGAKAWGRATAALDMGLYRAGVRSKITFFDNWLETFLTAGYSGVSGTISYVCNALTIELKLILDQARWKRWKRVWKEKASKSLTRWHAGSMRYVFFRK